MVGIGDEQDQREDSGFFGRPRGGQDEDNTESEERHVGVQSQVERLEAETRNRDRGRTGTETEESGGVRPRPSQREEETTEQSRFPLAGMAAGRGAARGGEMVHDLWTHEGEEKEDDKTVETKEEKVAVKAEVPDTDVHSFKLITQGIERFSKEELPWKGAGDGTNYEKAVKKEPARTASGFIPRYSGSESRRPDRPGLGWSWSHSQEVGSFPGQQPVGGMTISKVMSGSSANNSDAYHSLYGVGGGKSMGAVGPPNKSLQQRASSGSTELFNSPRAGQTAGNMSGLQGNPLSNLPPIALSNAVPHVVKSLTQFFSDSATVEKVRLFWNAFEANTEGLPDQFRLLVFSQKLKGREAERWSGNSSIRDFKTLKLRFHNHFLSRTADELWEWLQTRNENEESLLRNYVQRYAPPH
ncbi:hypothetical protein PHMEG_0006667 [Phytophthora megakarya]|uniref:Uncharacterized protein n=1 Tax=Phytophthora megakarya TaxID=4795 RepID=A0A225WNC8_9STRA|nr:hypothetical protein PHMEG_0006667 [Phytophthora megakarya]